MSAETDELVTVLSAGSVLLAAGADGVWLWRAVMERPSAAALETLLRYGSCAVCGPDTALGWFIEERVFLPYAERVPIEALVVSLEQGEVFSAFDEPDAHVCLQCAAEQLAGIREQIIGIQ